MGLAVAIRPSLPQWTAGTVARFRPGRVDAEAGGSIAGVRPAVALVDHGSPAPEVNAVRNVLAGPLSVLLEGEASRVVASSTERRAGDEYRFNEPLPENLLGQPGFERGLVVVAMLFLSPGRHAGPGGNAAGICRDAQACHPGLSTRMTPLVAEQPAVVEILADRVLDPVPGRQLMAVLIVAVQPAT